MLVSALTLLAGIVVLVLFSDWLVDGAVWAARRLGVSPFAVGLTIVAYGTSLPEAVVSVTAGLDNLPEFAIGNIVGSNIANIGLVLGFTALVAPITVAHSSSLFKTEAPWLIATTIIATSAGACGLFSPEHSRGPLIFVGITLVTLSFLYTMRTLNMRFGIGPIDDAVEAIEGTVRFLRRTILRGGRNVRENEDYGSPKSTGPQPIYHHIGDTHQTTAIQGSHTFDALKPASEGDAGDDSLDERNAADGEEYDGDEAECVPWSKICRYLLGGLVGLVGGAKLIVMGGGDLAAHWGVSERVIAVTIVAIGTSLPELAASVAAARRGHPELAVGNVVGSCLFNLTFVLGVAAIAAPITLDWSSMWVDFVVMLALTIGMFWLLWSDKVLTRVEAAILVTFYVGFLTFVGLQVLEAQETEPDEKSSKGEQSQVYVPPPSQLPAEPVTLPSRPS